MRQTVTAICCVSFAVLSFNFAKMQINKSQNTVQAAVPLTELLSPIRTEVHDTIKVPDSIAHDTIPVPKVVKKTVYRTKLVFAEDNAPIVNNPASESGQRVNSPVNDSVQSSHTNTREVRKGTPPDKLHAPSVPEKSVDNTNAIEVHGYIWPVQ